MNAGAVIVRELRAESRRAANYWLRVLAAGALVAVFASIMLASQPGLAQVGIVLFAGLNQAFQFALWVLVPLMTADCISREKREGTLGLLFLTPLTVLDVIAGKVTIHVLRALTLFLGALPLLGLPLVLGGVDWRWLLMSAAGQANAVLLGIAVGVYASTRGGSAIQVMVLAEACAVSLAVLTGFWNRHFAMALMGRPTRPGWIFGVLGIETLWTLTLFVTILRASVVRLRLTWHEEASAPEQPRWVRIFSNSQFWQEFFYWNKSRTLNRNPVAWLQEYSWTARLTKWGWFILLLLGEGIILTGDPSRRSVLWQPLMIVALGLGVAFSAAGSFRREQQSGLLELLMVTPLAEHRLLRGRLWGICCHYFPAIGLLWVGWMGDKLLNPKLYTTELMTGMVPNPVVFVAIMVVGLYLSLSRLNFFLAWLLTWIVAFVVPILGRIGLGRIAGAQAQAASGLPLSFQIGLAVLVWVLLRRKVRHREFALASGDQHLMA